MVQLSDFKSYFLTHVSDLPNPCLHNVKLHACVLLFGISFQVLFSEKKGGKVRYIYGMYSYFGSMSMILHFFPFFGNMNLFCFSFFCIYVCMHLKCGKKYVFLKDLKCGL